MFSLNFTPISFSHWYLANEEYVKKEYTEKYGDPKTQEETGECPECNGDGYQDCDMGHSHDCEECDGTGKKDQTAEQILEEYAGDLYREQVRRDKEKVARFLKEQEHVN